LNAVSVAENSISKKKPKSMKRTVRQEIGDDRKPEEVICLRVRIDVDHTVKRVRKENKPKAAIKLKRQRCLRKPTNHSNRTPSGGSANIAERAKHHL
jgi:hypothetical protein